MKTGILLTLLIVTCLVASFGLQIGALLQTSSKTETTSSFDPRAFVLGNILKPNGGGEVPGPGIPR